MCQTHIKSLPHYMTFFWIWHHNSYFNWMISNANNTVENMKTPVVWSSPHSTCRLVKNWTDPSCRKQGFRPENAERWFCGTFDPVKIINPGFPLAGLTECILVKSVLSILTFLAFSGCFIGVIFQWFFRPKLFHDVVFVLFNLSFIS